MTANYEAANVIMLQVAANLLQISKRNMQRIKDPQPGDPVLLEAEIPGRVAVVHLLNTLSEALTLAVDGLEKVQRESTVRMLETDTEKGLLVRVGTVGDLPLFRKTTPAGVQYWTVILGARVMVWDPTVTPADLLTLAIKAEAERT